MPGFASDYLPHRRGLDFAENIGLRATSAWLDLMENRTVASAHTIVGSPDAL